MSDEEKDYIAAPSPTEQMVASKPPRARVEDAVDPDEETAGEKLARKRDYLDGFLKKKPEASSETGARSRKSTTPKSRSISTISA